MSLAANIVPWGYGVIVLSHYDARRLLGLSGDVNQLNHTSPNLLSDLRVCCARLCLWSAESALQPGAVVELCLASLTNSSRKAQYAENPELYVREVL